MDNRERAQLLRDAALIVETNGLGAGAHLTPTGEVCAAGALYLASGYYSPEDVDEYGNFERDWLGLDYGDQVLNDAVLGVANPRYSLLFPRSLLNSFMSVWQWNDQLVARDPHNAEREVIRAFMDAADDLEEYGIEEYAA